MRLSTRTHGFIDFFLGALLVVGPWALGFGGTTAGWITVLFGVALIANTLTTNFELGRRRLIEVPVHLWVDGVIGLLLVLSPWLFAFDRTAWIPHVVAGALVMLLALLTNTVPERDRRAPRGAD